MFIKFLSILISIISLGTVDILDSYEIHSIDKIAYEELTYRDIFENDTDGITLPNDIKTFEISGNNLVQKVKKYILLNSDIMLLDSLDQWQRVQINKPLDYIGYNLFYTPLGSVQIEGFTNANYTNSSSMIDKITADAYAFRFSLGYNLGTYADLTAAKADISDKVIYYQLATPIILHTFNTAPSQEQVDEMLEYYLEHKDYADISWNFNELGIKDLILFSSGLLLWFIFLKSIKKGFRL